MSPHGSKKSKRLVGLFLLGAVVFNFPLLSLFNYKTCVLGFPLLYVYIFGGWLLMIAAMMLTTSGHRSTE